MTIRIVRFIALWILSALIPIFGNAWGKDTYINPVLIKTFNIARINPDHFIGILGIGDPSVIYYDGRYYLYPTGDNRSYDVYISSDLVNWKAGPKVFESAEHGVWAPDVFYDPGNNQFYLYYTVNRRIGVALSERPDSIFKDQGTLVKNAIDAHMFLDEDGRYYLYYAEYPAFRIHVQPMETPVRKQGKPVLIIQPDKPWEKKPYPLTEAPWMLKHRETYYLLYSGGGADTQYYAIGYATARSPLGPFSKHPDPIFEKGNGVFGPGHPSIIKDREGKLWMVYHQQKDESRGWNRIICIDPLRFDESGVLRGNATRAKLQPSPVTTAP